MKRWFVIIIAALVTLFSSCSKESEGSTFRNLMGTYSVEGHYNMKGGDNVELPNPYPDIYGNSQGRQSGEGEITGETITFEPLEGHSFKVSGFLRAGGWVVGNKICFDSAYSWSNTSTYLRSIIYSTVLENGTMELYMTTTGMSSGKPYVQEYILTATKIK
ncbi:MAG: hypothetical protein MJY56_07680 [Bacteroidales bacterium]|nr:hypothetical protein [Bacteroidales bacterium]